MAGNVTPETDVGCLRTINPILKSKSFIQSIMKTKTLFYFFVLLTGLSISSGCSQKDEHFITDSQYRATVEEDLKIRKEIMGEELFADIFNDSLKLMEREAMEFLYAYMNTADIADYTPEFYLKNIHSSFKARQEMTWGKNVPEKLFRHFVLPVRVNNENLDESRMVFYNELKERVQNLSMKEAALEVNHWCHEKATYAPSDGRTRSPLSTVLNALGRCGEESTFTVAALRSVGIPARQVYTPRWAHTDDNHAWVEVWVDGKWHFMGACEPAADLNDAWFNSSVVRAMLIHTKVFGRYDGPEEVLYTTKNYTEINVIDNYTETDELSIKVVDIEGNAVDNAAVRYCIYNYAEFNPVVTKYTDISGESSLRIGKGDMLVWAFKDGKYGHAVSKTDERTQLIITLNDFGAMPEEISFKINPPTAAALPTTATPEQAAENEKRLVYEDSIRHSYEATFASEQSIESLASNIGISKERIASYLKASRGNHAAIEKFLLEAEKKEKAVALLSVISEKDLTDTPLEKLQAIYSEMPDTDNDFSLRHVANPRIGVELLTAYRGDILKAFSAEEQAQIKTNPTLLAEWIGKNIKQDSVYNSQRMIASPRGILSIKWADSRSTESFFVAAARSLGIPSRIDPVTGKVQYSMPGAMEWVDINLQQQTSSTAPKGMLKMLYKPTTVAPDPQYYSRYSLACINPDGALRTLEYDWDGGLGWSDLFKTPRAIDAGDYLLISGTRMASGSVLCNMKKIRVPESNDILSVPLILPQDSTDIQVIGSINAEQVYHDIATGEEKTILSTTGRGYFVLAVLAAGQEPSNHALKDIQLLAKEFETWERKLILLFPDESNYKRFRNEEFKELPNTVVWGWDLNGTNAKMMATATNLPNNTELPIFVIADTFGRVVFVRQGYTIGLGEQMMNVIRRL